MWILFFMLNSLIWYDFYTDAEWEVMGGGVAGALNSAGIFYNPAGHIDSFRKIDLSFSFRNLYNIRDLNYLSFGMLLNVYRGFLFGVGWWHGGVKDLLIRNIIFLNFAYGVKSLRIGLNAGLLARSFKYGEISYSRDAIFWGSGVRVFFKNFILAFSGNFLNSPKLKYIDEKETIKPLWLTGLVYKNKKYDFLFNFSYNFGIKQAGLGFEKKFSSLRVFLGYTENFNFGFGLDLGKFDFNFGYVNKGLDLKGNYYVSFGLYF
ncbi:hypothetical protein DRN73_05465 [Candidatus Pacearchaeota archaeon]|nr:MAG: hypothetical protein DRN73_05465 [Candidatus Pacearchaeota archaeon]